MPSIREFGAGRSVEVPVPSAKAPSYPVPPQPIMAIEHPFAIRDIDRGIMTLGGPESLSTVRNS